MNVEMILASKGREVSTIEPNATVGEALHRLRTERIGALVVSEDRERIKGIISDREIMWALDERGVDVLSESVGSVMNEQPFTCSRHERVSVLMATMTDRRIRHVPVVEKDGRLCGIVSLGDVIKYRLDEIRREVRELEAHIKSIL
jgi:CBS domain-containing protein